MRGKGEEEDEEEKVPPSVKRQLLLAQRALRERDFPGAEAAYHRALQLLGGSEHAESRAYIEARAVTLDKVVCVCVHCNYRIVRIISPWAIYLTSALNRVGL